ncbi:MAG: VWA domain-containing protein [Fuerstiella sp.]
MAVTWPQPEFSQPTWLWALLVLPALVVVFRRSLVDLPWRQKFLSLITRSAIVVLLVLAMSGLTLWIGSVDVFVIFAVDQSLSVDQDRAAEVSAEFIERATRDASPERFAVLPFARHPATFQSGQATAAAAAAPPVSASDQTSGQTAWRQATSLQSAIELSAASVPPGLVPHIVLLSDGNETDGDVLSAATSSVRVSTVPLPTRDEPEIQVSAVNVPTQVAEGEPFSVEVLVDANHDDQVVVEVFSGDFRVAAEPQSVSTGENRFTFTQQVQQPTQFTARIRSANDGTAGFSDTLIDNNMASGLVFTAGRPRVLMIQNQPEPARSLVWAMQEEGIELEVRPAAGLPTSLSELQNFDVLILSNIPANEMTTPQMEMIRAYVSELGGGFLMLGGDESFGLGGYYRTVIEEVLPVRCDFEKEKEKPGLGMVLIIDKSGSMGGQKIELAKEAARAAVELLGDKDQIGVIAFDGAPYWVSEMKSGAQKGAILDRIASIEAGGGTTLYPAMEEAFQTLQATTARLKHVIILTDGYSTPGDFDGITQNMTAARITISTVGIGDADQDLLQRIAQAGSGRYYFSSDASSIPQIFAKETIAAGRSAVREEPFLPMLVRATPVLDGIDFDEAPFLLGYVVTGTKATSEVILTTETGEPLLAWWRYGLGMSAAFTSDASSQWAAEWLTWPGFNKFWAQVIRHCMRPNETRGFAMQVEHHGRFSRIVIDAVDGNRRFLNGADTELVLVDPQLKSQTVTIPQTGPGRYETVVETSEPGVWQLQVIQKIEQQTVYQQSRGLVVGYPEELRIRDVNKELLMSVAAVTGGTFQPVPEAVFEAGPQERATSAVPLRPWLLSLAALLFVVDVAIRRLDLSGGFRRVFRGGDSNLSSS